MAGFDQASRLKLENVLVATDFSPASKAALIYAISIARLHQAKLLVVHVSSSHSEGGLMDAWRAGQTDVMEQFIAGGLSGVPHELLVKAGDVWTVLSDLIAERQIDLLVVGTRGRTGVWKLLLGSVAESIFRQAPCPVLTVGPSFSGADAEAGLQRILVPTGFAPQSLQAVSYGLRLARDLHSSIALLHVVASGAVSREQEQIRSEKMARLRALIPAGENVPTEYFVEFGAVTEKILEIAAGWKANLIALGLHHREVTASTGTAWAKAYEIVCKASCPVLTVRLSE